MLIWPKELSKINKRVKCCTKETQSITLINKHTLYHDLHTSACLKASVYLTKEQNEKDTQ